MDFSADLSTESEEFNFYPNVVSKKIQLKYGDFSGKFFQMTELQMDDPVTIMDRR